MNNYKILTPTLRGSFTERLAELEMLVGDWLELEQTEGRLSLIHISEPTRPY